MNRIYLAPVDTDWMQWFDRTVDRPIDLTDAPIEELQDLNQARVWGTTTSKRKQTFFDEMSSGDIILFYHDAEFFAKARADRVFENPKAGKWLWENFESRFIYTVTDYQETSIPVEKVNKLLGYSSSNVPNGFVRVSETAITNLLNNYASVEKAFQDLS